MGKLLRLKMVLLTFCFFIISVAWVSAAESCSSVGVVQYRVSDIDSCSTQQRECCPSRTYSEWDGQKVIAGIITPADVIGL